MIFFFFKYTQAWFISSQCSRSLALVLNDVSSDEMRAYFDLWAPMLCGLVNALLSSLVGCSKSSGKHQLKFPATAAASALLCSAWKCGWFFIDSKINASIVSDACSPIVWPQGTWGYWAPEMWPVQIEMCCKCKLHIIFWRRSRFKIFHKLFSIDCVPKWYYSRYAE